MDQIERFKMRIERERKARKEAEFLLQSKARELYDANQQLLISQKALEEENKRRTYDLIKVQKLAKIASWRWNIRTNSVIWSAEMVYILELPHDINVDTTNINKARLYLKNCSLDDRKRLIRFVRNILRSNQKDITPDDLKIEHSIYVDGEKKHINMICECSWSENGKLEIILGTIQDVSKQREYEEILLTQQKELNKRVKELEKLHEDLVKAQVEAEIENRNKSEFLSTVNHELRTPLTSIHGSLELIKAMTPDHTLRRSDDLIDIAYRNSQRLKFLVNDILDTEKIDSGNIKFNFADYELRELLENSLQLNRPYAQKYDVVFVLDNKIPDVIIRADKDRFIQILSNLLSNAAKFSPEKEVITTSAQRKEDKIIISVQDNGSGMPKEFKDRIFKKFAQAERSDDREKEGTGLGLYLTKEMVERHKGEITFETKEGEGTTFFITLPCKKRV